MNKFSVISTIIENALKENIIYGISYSFIKNNNVENYYKGVYGKNESFKLKKINSNSIYDLASLTKVIGTTTMILKLLDRKKINLNDRVIYFCNEFRNDKTTIIELLLHNSGLAADLDDKTNITIEKIFKQTNIKMENYNKTVYSDIGFIILGFIIESITKLNLEKAFKNYIFNCVNMNHTTYNIKDAYYCVPTEITDKRGIICSKPHDSKAFALGEIGSAGLFSTLGDLNIFAKHIINNDGKIISKESLYKLININIGNRTLGWDKKYGKYSLYHTGFTGTSILINLKLQEALIILTNRIHTNRHNTKFLELREEINKVFMGD